MQVLDLFPIRLCFVTSAVPDDMKVKAEKDEEQEEEGEIKEDAKAASEKQNEGEDGKKKSKKDKKKKKKRKRSKQDSEKEGNEGEDGKSKKKKKRKKKRKHKTSDKENEPGKNVPEFLYLSIYFSMAKPIGKEKLIYYASKKFQDLLKTDSLGCIFVCPPPPKGADLSCFVYVNCIQ